MAGLRKGRDRRTVRITREWQTKGQVTESTKCPCEEWGFYPVNNGEPVECGEKSGKVGCGVGQRAVIPPEPGIQAPRDLGTQRGGLNGCTAKEADSQFSWLF